jgi:hypothetical protein
MSASIETMFYTWEVPWHGLGTRVEDALYSKDALIQAGLDLKVTQRSISTKDSYPIPGHKANIREMDNKILGVITDRYKIVQNDEAFAFTDSLFNEGIHYDTAGSLQEGKNGFLQGSLKIITLQEMMV